MHAVNMKSPTSSLLLCCAILFLSIVIAGVSTLVSAAGDDHFSIYGQPWVLSKKSGTDNSSNNVPLFGNVSFFIPMPDPTTGATEMQFCFATNYSFRIPINTKGNGSSSFVEDTHLFFQNMFLGLEYVVGTTAQVRYGLFMKSMLNLTMQRQIASSQRISKVFEEYVLSLYYDSENRTTLSMMSTRFYQGSRGGASWTNWIFQPSSTLPFGCPNQGVASSSARLDHQSRVVRSHHHHHHPRRGDLIHKMIEEQKKTRRTHDKTNAENEQQEDQLRSTWLAERRAAFVARKKATEALPSPQEQKKLLGPKATSKNTKYVVFVNNTWNITKGDLDVNAFILGVQGLVNRISDTGMLYLVYPPTWDWTDSLAILDFYNQTHDNDMYFVVLRTAHEVADTFACELGVDTYIRWSKKSRECLLAGWTMAGVHSSFLIEESDAAPNNENGLLAVINRRRTLNGVPTLSLGVDLVGVFDTKTTAESAMWLYSKVWANVSKDYIVYIGGVEGDSIYPAVADWAVAKKAFVADLSTSPYNQKYIDEYHVSKMLLSKMNPDFLFCGWHAYGKDEEHTMTTLVSQSKGTVEGLNTQPNFSFNNKVPLPSGYRFVPNRMPVPKNVAKQNKVFMSLVQTDGIGLGAWTKKGRGLLPYNWEVTLPDLKLQPAVLRFFYSQATKNDFFVGALGGPGYMYPKAVPADYLPHQLRRAQNIMNDLGLQTMIIFDASQAGTSEFTTTSNTNLNKTLVNVYCKWMPESAGFLNGYTNAYTFQVCPKQQQVHHDGDSNDSDHHDHGKTQKQNDETVGLRRGPGSLLSFDYYVDMSRNANAIVQDFKQLFYANPVRPYFLAVHVREWNSEQRVSDVIHELMKQAESEIELVTSDVLVTLAGEHPTFRTHHH